jgi:hypothetical protein
MGMGVLIFSQEWAKQRAAEMGGCAVFWELAQRSESIIEPVESELDPMIRATSGADAPLTLTASVSGVAIYLDNFSLIRLAKHDPLRRQRFIAALRTGADLLFSVTNAVELAGPLGNTLEAVRILLDEIGAHWFPVEMNPFRVSERELAGASVDQSCIATEFMKQYFTARTTGYTPGSGRVISLSEDFYCLGPVVDWLAPQRESIRTNTANLDGALINKISQYRNEHERDPGWLDRTFPPLPYVESKPATFTYVNLVRTLILEAKSHQLKKGDGNDFCHAVIASAFASVATLDKHWKRRIEALPTPNKLARIYYQPQLDTMMSDIESVLESKKSITARESHA